MSANSQVIPTYAAAVAPLLRGNTSSSVLTQAAMHQEAKGLGTGNKPPSRLEHLLGLEPCTYGMGLTNFDLIIRPGLTSTLRSTVQDMYVQHIRPGTYA